MSYIYFIKSGHEDNAPIKIGVAKNVKSRLSYLQIGNPCKLVLVASIKADSDPHAYWLEKNLHKFFRSNHIRGEWFSKINMKKAEKICLTKPIQGSTKNQIRNDL